MPTGQNAGTSVFRQLPALKIITNSTDLLEQCEIFRQKFTNNVQTCSSDFSGFEQNLHRELDTAPGQNLVPEAALVDGPGTL